MTLPRLRTDRSSSKATPIEEQAIREALRRHLAGALAADPSARIIEELGLCQGNARVDVALVNGILSGYEIKSDLDTLDRLPGQRAVYNRALEQVTIVCTRRHLAAVRRRIPSWWGIIVAELPAAEAGALYYECGPSTVRCTQVRPPADNPATDPRAMAELLWRSEVASLLAAEGALTGLRSAPRERLWDRLVELFGPDRVRLTVREHLKSRAGWRSDEPRG